MKHLRARFPRPDLTEDEWRQGYVDFAREIRARWAKTFPVEQHPDFHASQLLVDSSVATLCRELNLDPVLLVDAMVSATPAGSDAVMAEDDLATHKLLSALAVVVPKLDAERATKGGGS